MPANHNTVGCVCHTPHAMHFFIGQKINNTPNRLYDTHIHICTVHIMAEQYNNLTKCEAHCALAAINIFYVHILY